MPNFNVEDPIARLQKTPSPTWLEEMRKHFQQTGTFRPDDLRRLVGNPAAWVDIGPKTDAAIALKRQDQT